MNNSNWSASWIWAGRRTVHAYNQTAEAVRTFDCAPLAEAWLRITADTAYRLTINDEWVANGPARFWPEHACYDRLDVTPWLRAGRNTIRIIVKYHGCGSFHHVPRQAGLLCQLDAVLADGDVLTLGTDRTWRMRLLPAWLSNTPKISSQKGPCEVYDARLEDALTPLRAASVLFPATEGPWKDLRPSGIPPLTRLPVAFRRCTSAAVVRRSRDRIVSIPRFRLAHPGLISSNKNVSQACVLAAILRVPDARTVFIGAGGGCIVTVNGQTAPASRFDLAAGDHFLLITVIQPFDHGRDLFITFGDWEGLELINPRDPVFIEEQPWCVGLPPESAWVGDDMDWPAATTHPAQRERLAAIPARVRCWADFQREFKGRMQCPPAAAMLLVNPYLDFHARVPLDGVTPDVRDPAALMADNAERTWIAPHPAGDVELAYDLGGQVCGYWQFDLWCAEDGVAVDIFAIEHIMPGGELQHTWDRNGLRFIARKGNNRFLSFERRSGRYLYITLRNQTGPVAIRHFQVVESTYPVDHASTFACSDPRLDRIREISARTLQLCMEDTFTDCPLYEQTLWVGDARNEALFAYTTFGAADLARRCLRLAAESLDRYPLVGCQVPSAWDCLLPAWSFLWGIGVYDYYFHTGDADTVRELWPAVMRNLRNADGMRDARGLFSGPFWNLFDWAPIDDKHRTVLHNSMFLVGALDAARKLAGVLGEAGDAAWLRDTRTRLAAAINACWRGDRQAYPDSIHDDGTVSPSVSQHTAFLALLYDIAPPPYHDALLALMTAPPEGVTRVGSPFAILYLYEALEKAELDAAIIASVYAAYLPMLEAGASTVWESFPSSGKVSKFPTRSHCHAWSSAPLYVLPRIVLGIRPTAPGWTSCTISPRPSGLTWARGSVVTPQGLLDVAWRLDGRTLRLEVRAPAGVAWSVTRNPALDGLELVINDK